MAELVGELGDDDVRFLFRDLVQKAPQELIDTELSAGSLQGEGRKRIEAGIPIGRVASADDVAGPILFLCSSLGRHVTGEILNVNGGAVLVG